MRKSNKSMKDLKADARWDFIHNPTYCGPLPNAFVVFDLMEIDEELVFHRDGGHAAHYQMKDTHTFKMYERWASSLMQKFKGEYLAGVDPECVDWVLENLLMGDGLEVAVEGDHAELPPVGKRTYCLRLIKFDTGDEDREAA
jgi:hypothetical protein